ncbi:MAG TPA: hypothetical protein VI521_02620, partial [Candidatus Babeliales bacterium]|nr:hypothetical protein [Candidatus Babeliales bacterium]
SPAFFKAKVSCAYSAATSSDSSSDSTAASCVASDLHPQLEQHFPQLLHDFVVSSLVSADFTVLGLGLPQLHFVSASIASDLQELHFPQLLHELLHLPQLLHDFVSASSAERRVAFTTSAASSFPVHSRSHSANMGALTTKTHNNAYFFIVTP